MVGRGMRESRAVRSEGMSGGWFVVGCGPGRLCRPGRVGGGARSPREGRPGFPLAEVCLVERACRADVSRAVAGMEQDGFCPE